MGFKTFILILLTAAVTAILVSNTGTMELWLFGTYTFSKLAVLGSMLGIGFILGLIARSGSSKKSSREFEDYEKNSNSQADDVEAPYLKKTSTLSDEDRDYIN